jgi:uncharacterized protein (DUF433 family)
MGALEQLTAKPPPWRLDDDGVRRLGKTRVRLETVLFAFNHGASAEEILLKYPSLRLEDIYSVITYYFWHRKELEAYLEARAAAEETVEKEVERVSPNDGIRDRLVARRKA